MNFFTTPILKHKINIHTCRSSVLVLFSRFFKLVRIMVGVVRKKRVTITTVLIRTARSVHFQPDKDSLALK